MKTKIFYICETCNNISSDIDIIQICEANHLGLTVNEHFCYKALEEIVRRTSYKVSVTKNTETEKAYDEAIKELMDFEEKHNIK